MDVFTNKSLAVRPSQSVYWFPFTDTASREANKPVTPPAGGGGNTPPVKPATPVKTFVRKESAMNIPFNKPMLETEEDVNAYLEALRTKMMSYINQNKNIMLN